jgi:hypothetical protein
MRSDQGSGFRTGYSSREISLINVDLPQPLGPRIATCSPCAIEMLTLSNAMRSSRRTVTFSSSIRGINSLF